MKFPLKSYNRIESGQRSSINSLTHLWISLKWISFCYFSSSQLINPSFLFLRFFFKSLIYFPLWQFKNRWYPPPYNVLSLTYGPTHLITPSMTIPILWQSTSASSIEWVVMMIAHRPLTSARMSQSYLLFSGSSPVEGSSRKTIFGSPTNEIATLSLLFMPPDSCLVRFFALSVR